MKVVYCANCGTKLSISRKALPKYGKIIDVVEYHTCPDEPIPLDLTPNEVPPFVEMKEKNKFVQNLNDLKSQSILGSIGTNALRDRREETPIKSSAPASIIDSIGKDIHTTPAHNIEDIDNDD